MVITLAKNENAEKYCTERLKTTDEKFIYSGYFSDTESEDIEDFVAAKMTADDYTKTSRQLMVSFEGMSGMLAGFGIIVFMMIIYLLSKIIIEKNAQSIYMTKILGYSNSEINSLYIASVIVVISYAVIAFLQTRKVKKIPLDTALKM